MPEVKWLSDMRVVYGLAYVHTYVRASSPPRVDIQCTGEPLILH